jgi:outer membrane murein-binding lipoprotein Lpp
MRVVLTAVAALGLMLAGCSRDHGAKQGPIVRPSTVVEPETRVDTVPQEEPAVARSQWRAVNEQARALTGNLRVSLEGVRGGPLVFAFADGVTIRAQSYGVAPADSRSGVGGQSFAAVLGGDPRVDVYLYRVLDENVSSSAAQGGLCGEARTRNLAVSEFVDSSGRWVFKVAAFRGEATPPSSADPQLCSAYTFTAQ